MLTFTFSNLNVTAKLLGEYMFLENLKMTILQQVFFTYFMRSYFSKFELL